MSIKRKSLKISSLLVAGVLGATTLALSACSTLASEIDTLITYNPTDILAINNSPLNGSFTNSPISTSMKTEMLNLLDYQTTGQFKFSGDDSQTKTDSSTHDFLTLSGASALIIFKSDDVKTAFDTSKSIDLNNSSPDSQEKILNSLKEIAKESTINGNGGNVSSGSTTTTSSYKEGTDFWIFLREKGAIQLQKGPKENPETPLIDGDKVAQPTQYYSDAISNGSVYQFIVDTDNKWVDSNGKEQIGVSSKDFERAIEAYYLSAELSYNRNGYFLDLLGIDPNKTIGSGSTTNGTDSFNIVDPNYNVEDYANKNDAVFTLYLNAPYVYANDLLSKDFFAALPHTNQKVKNITLAGSTEVSKSTISSSKTTTTYKSLSYPIVYTKTETTSSGSKSTSYSIDESNTDWNRIFGSGGLQYFMQDAWFAGAYYISNFSASKVVFQLNKSNLNTVGKHLLDYESAIGYDDMNDDQKGKVTDKRIETINYVFGSGTADVYYQMFKSNQISYLSGVPDAYKSEAAELFGGDNGLVPIKTVQISQSNYITYTPVPYVLSDDDKVVPNSYISENFAKFDYQWTSKNSMIIRAAISGLINHYQLSLINLPQSGDFQLSATPYGVFGNYYQSVANSSFFGGLPRPYSDYVNSPSYILNSFEIPYYKYEKNNGNSITIEKITVSKETLKSALSAFGATQTSPLVFSYKLGEGSISNNYQSYLNSLTQQIESISDGLISFRTNLRNGTNPTFTEWYNGQASPLGFSYWSPDYNGVGTWIEADTTLQSGNVEAVPGTNAHNGYLTFLSALVSAVKLSNASWSTTSSGSSNGTTNGGKYAISTTGDNGTTTDPFQNDERIQKAFSSANKTSLGISSWSSDLGIQENDNPGTIYSKLAIGLVNTLISEGVFNQSKFDEYVNDPSKLSLENKTPSSEDDIYLGNDVIETGKSAEFSKWLGIYAGQGTDKALFENLVLDSDYSFIPRSEAGLNEFIYTLVSKQFQARASSVTPLNYRDFSKK